MQKQWWIIEVVRASQRIFLARCYATRGEIVTALDHPMIDGNLVTVIRRPK